MSLLICAMAVYKLGCLCVLGIWGTQGNHRVPTCSPMTPSLNPQGLWKHVLWSGGALGIWETQALSPETSWSGNCGISGSLCAWINGVRGIVLSPLGMGSTLAYGTMTDGNS